MMDDSHITQALYRMLLTFYPQEFRERLAESMEQTFHDLCYEKRQAKNGVFRFVLWAFVETAHGIIRERLLLVNKGDTMQTALGTLGLSGGISFLLILPLIIMEVVNRRQFNEDFPFVLFFAMWLNLFAFTLISMPIVRGKWMRSREEVVLVPAQSNTLLSKPWSAALISVALMLAPGILPLLDSLGWLSLDRLFNGPNPEVTYLPGLFLTVSLILFPITAGIIAGIPIVRTLRVGGSLFAHPIHLIIIAFIVSAFAIGFTSLLIDQWPCFIGVPVCD